MNTTLNPLNTLPLRKALPYAAVAAVAFHLAYASPALSLFIVVYSFCLFQLARVGTARQASYLGLAVGLLTVGPQLHCFWTIFGPSAIALWYVLAFWIGLFVALARLCLIRFGPVWAVMLAPFLWTGLEYFRSELYYLRFSWLNVGYAFSNNLPLPGLNLFGMYGVGFLAMAIAAAFSLRSARIKLVAASAAALIAGVALLHSSDASKTPADKPAKSPLVAGVQLEFPAELEVVFALNKALTAAPEADLFVLSEYTFDGPVPNRIKRWCRDHRRYLIVGGKDPAPKANFYDTAFVIGPTGEIIFRQVKAVPIQFFKDGLPAPEQKLWESPWGKIGICVCYDLSYTRVTDQLVRLGAEALIVPTMDVADWGKRQHELHARVAPIRAAEYGLPIFRVASSGISQLVDRAGRVTAKASFPGQSEIVTGRLVLQKPGSLPFDRWVAPFATGVIAMLILWLLIKCRTTKPLGSPKQTPEQALQEPIRS